MSKRVFISFDPADREWVGHLGRALAHRGWEPSVERSQLHAAETPRQRLVRDLEASDALVVVLSASSASSSQVIDELALTRKYGTELIAIRLDDSQPCDAIATELKGAPTIPFHGREARTQFDKLDRALGRAAAQSYRVMTGELETLMPDDGGS